MNRYLLVQGDCRNVLLYIKSKSIQQIVTSPPYYMQAKYGGMIGEIGTKGTLDEYIRRLTEAFIQLHRVLKPTGTFMLNIDSPKREKGLLTFSAWDFIPILREVGFKLSQTIIWVDKDRRTLYHPKILNHYYEPIFILTKGSDYVFNWKNAPKGDVWEIQHYRGREADKGDVWDRCGVATWPVDLVNYLVALGSNEGDTTLDPFAGSGTLMDVSQRLRRNSIAIEINPASCETIMKRCFNRNNIYRYITQGELERGEAKL